MNDESYLTTRATVLDIIARIKTKDPLKLLSALNDFGQEKNDIMERLGILMTGYRDALVYKETGDRESLVNQDYIDIIKSVAESESGRDIVGCIRAVDRAFHALNQNANKQLTLEVMMFTLGRHHE